MNKIGVNISKSNYVDFLEMSSILSKNRLELRPILQCFRCFDNNIWTLILISILSLSVISSLRQQSVYSLYEYIYNYLITLLSQFPEFHKTFIQEMQTYYWCMAIVIYIFQHNIFIILFRRYGITITNH